MLKEEENCFSHGMMKYPFQNGSGGDVGNHDSHPEMPVESI